MPTAPPSDTERAAIASARRLIADGRPADAAAALVPALSSASRHPDLLIALAQACEAAGQVAEAMEALRQAIQADPDRADHWAEFGRLLHENGSHGEAVRMLDEAVARDPDRAESWYNLGLAAQAAGESARAVAAFEKAVALAPSRAAAWAGLGFAQEQGDALAAAEASLARALALDPASILARHHLAIVLRRTDRASEALALTEGAAPAPTRLLRAHLLAELGHDEAVEAYRSALRDDPQALDGHATYARLMPQLGRGEEALSTYRAALDAQPTLPLLLSALGSARDLRATEALLDMARWAQEKFGSLPEIKAFEALGLAQRGDHAGALAILEPLAAAGQAGVLGHCAFSALALGDVARAERQALAATSANPFDQGSWALLTIVWRLSGDGRERWLADYERLVMPIDLDPPAGMDRAGFMAALAVELDALHTMQAHPADQSLRGGTQTRGHLFDKRSPMVRALRATIERQVAARLATLDPDPAHPFLSRLGPPPRFVGSWSVRLRSGGFHVGHIHHEGWLSSALYVALPPGMEDAEPGSASPGALVFGRPPEQLAVDLAPRRIEQPRVGRLVVFPSYFWHGTLPFESADAPRMTVAFDMVPAA